MIFFPPEIVEQVLEAAETNVALKARERDLLRGWRHRFRDVYPLSPELREQWERDRRPRE